MNASLSYSSNELHPHGLVPENSSHTKPLWAAIGVLSVCLVAMGASLVHIHKVPAEPTAAHFAPNSLVSLMDTQTPAADSKTSKSIDAAERAPAKASAKPAPAKTQVASAKPTSNTAATQSSESPASEQAARNVMTQAPAPESAKPVCANCGTVQSVTPVIRNGKGSGVGMVAGGVLGAVLGNQVGKGDGRTVGTVVGAVGGGWAGNAIEKNMKKTTVYAVQVRMEDGSTRSLEQATAPAVGSKVTVEGNTLRGSDGAVYSPAPEQRARVAPPQAQRDIYSTGG